MKPFVIQFQIQGVLPAQMIDDLLAGSSVRHFLHKLQKRHPAKQHRIDRRPAVLQAVKRFHLRRKFQKLGPNLFPKEPVAVGWTEKISSKIVGVIEASLSIQGSYAHRKTMKAIASLV